MGELVGGGVRVVIVYLSRQFNNMGAFNIGAVVRLKSEGPAMTVRRIVGEGSTVNQSNSDEAQGHRDGDVICPWFIPPSNTEMKEAAFPPESLELDE